MTTPKRKVKKVRKFRKKMKESPKFRKKQHKKLMKKTSKKR